MHQVNNISLSCILDAIKTQCKNSHKNYFYEGKMKVKEFQILTKYVLDTVTYAFLSVCFLFGYKM